MTRVHDPTLWDAASPPTESAGLQPSAAASGGPTTWTPPLWTCPRPSISLRVTLPASRPPPPPPLGPSDCTGPKEKEFRIFSPSRDPSLDLVCKPLPGPVTRCRLPGMRAQASLGQAGGLAPHEDTESRPLRGRADAQGPACLLKGLALVQRTAEATLTTATAVRVPPSLRLTWRAGPAAVWVAKALCAWRHWAGVPAAPRHHACHHQYFDVGCSCGL